MISWQEAKIKRAIRTFPWGRYSGLDFVTEDLESQEWIPDLTARIAEALWGATQALTQVSDGLDEPVPAEPGGTNDQD